MLEAAREILRSEGLPALTMEAVARRVGVSRQTVHNQFGSRIALLEALIDSAAISGGMDRLREVFSETNPRRALEMLIAVFVGFWASDELLISRLHGLTAVDPELASQLEPRGDRRRKGLTLIVDRLREHGDLRTDAATEDVVDCLYLITGYTSYAELAARGRSRDEIIRILTHLAEAALQLPPAPATAAAP